MSILTVQISRDFTMELFGLIHRTFIDYDNNFTRNDYENHYKWCFENTLKIYANEGLFQDLLDESPIYKYYWSIYVAIYLDDEEKFECKTYYENNPIHKVFDSKSKLDTTLIKEIVLLFDNYFKETIA